MALSISVPDRLALHSVPVVHSKWLEPNPNDRPFDHRPQLKNEITYENRTGVELYVAFRDGAVLRFPSVTVMGPKVFSVLVSRKKSSSVKADFNLVAYASKTGRGLVELDDPYSGIEATYTQTIGSRMQDVENCKSRRCDITLESVMEGEGVVYDLPTDIVISRTLESARHPGSPQTRLESVYVPREVDLKESTRDVDLFDRIGVFGLTKIDWVKSVARAMVMIVDNADRFGSRYINMLGAVHRCKAVKSASLPDGLYIIRDESVRDNGITSNATVAHYTFEAIDESGIKLYRSRQDALDLGNPEAAAEKELIKLKQEAEVTKAENTKLKLDLERIQTQSKVTMTQTQDHFEHKSHQRKDYYEERSHNRKDSSEDLKYYIAGGTLFIGILAAILKK